MLNLTGSGRHVLGFASLSVIGLLAASVPSRAAATQAVRTGDITVPAMPMDRALDMIGRQSGVNVNFDPDAVK